MIETILKESRKNKTLVGLNYYGNDSGFFCGYVIEFNADFVVLQHYSKFGMPDGILVHKLADIKYFEKDTEYLRGIKLLIKHQELIHKQTFSLANKKGSIESLFFMLESLIGDKDYLVKFELYDGEIHFGFVEWCDEESLSIIKVDPDGLTGKALFKLEDVKLYWVDDLECRKRKVVYKARNASR